MANGLDIGALGAGSQVPIVFNRGNKEVVDVSNNGWFFWFVSSQQVIKDSQRGMAVDAAAIEDDKLVILLFYGINNLVGYRRPSAFFLFSRTRI